MRSAQIKSGNITTGAFHKLYGGVVTARVYMMSRDYSSYRGRCIHCLIAFRLLMFSDLELVLTETNTTGFSYDDVS